MYVDAERGGGEVNGKRSCVMYLFCFVVCALCKRTDHEPCGLRVEGPGDGKTWHMW